MVIAMRRLKMAAIYLVLCILLGLALVAVAEPMIRDGVSILANGWGTARYLSASAGQNGTICAVTREDGSFLVVLGNRTGRTETLHLSPAAPAGEAQVAALYPATDGTVFLALYERQAQELVLYRLFHRLEPELLLRETCSGVTAQDRRTGMRLSGFSEAGGVVSFALVDSDGVQVYHCTLDDTGLTAGNRIPQAGVDSAAVLTDGSLALSVGGSLFLGGAPVAYPVQDQRITQMTQAGTGLYYIDSVGLKVNYTDLVGSALREVLRLEDRGYPLNGVTSLTLTPEGDALLLLDGRTLLRDNSGGTENLSEMLYRPAGQCILLLGGLALTLLLVTTLLCYLIYRNWEMHLPMLLRQGLMMTAAALLCTVLVVRFWVEPDWARWAEEEAANVMTGAVKLVEEDPQEEQPQRLAASLSDAYGQQYRGVVSALITKSDGVWRMGERTGLPQGSRAELLPWFNAQAAEEALAQGCIFRTMDLDGGIWYAVISPKEEAVLVLAVDGGPLIQIAQENARRTASSLWAGAWAIIGLSLLLLLTLTRNLRRVAKGMERLASGDTSVRVHLHSADELEGLVDAFNSMSVTVEEQVREHASLAESYRCFVPESILMLLNKESIAQVDKTTFVSRQMSVMMVWFAFPEKVYDNSSRALFDNINEVIERTASIVSQKGGVVFNFAYDGYDAVLEGGQVLAVSTAVAVQQEILRLNAQREGAGLPPVRLRIALDVGNVMIGLVGDGKQMEPAAISSSFIVARKLIGLSNRLDTNILCTERIIAGAEGYGNRYMGKCRAGGESLRVYELFDGDPYDVRQVKQGTGRQFSEGVLALYSRNFTAAKRIFLELVHQNARDGGARYYLYLADRMEKSPEEDLYLEFDA